ncbi:ATP-binding protein [Streptomyces sp. B93]|uniref:ATP-binding protein n=1 Tax=Streptomyces sp. B93 TaxID=2824875 RepID=UPI001B3831A9|nr:ATP-binding protein [Streptomyces sp. B93]MBQ1091566.1 ATP-binding protein [Streptomyces sp. B93]
MDTRVLTAHFPATPRGAQLARRQAVRWMQERGHPPASDIACGVALVVGELAANAVQHGRVPGRDFGLRITADEAANHVRIEVTDAAPPPDLPPAPTPPHPEDESGRGLLLVDVLATHWGTTPHPSEGKTVWAELCL